MVHTIYRTTNLVNGKFYIGIHKTNDPNDNYLGSGKWLLRAVAKYGEENFKKEILHEFEEAEEAFKKEEELVELHRGHPLCYNLRKGGAGGFDYMNRNGFSALGGKRSGPTRKKLRAENPEYRKRQDDASRRSIAIALTYVTQEMRLRNLAKGVEAWRGQHHSEEYRRRKSLELLAGNSPTQGKRWVNLGTNGVDESTSDN